MHDALARESKVIEITSLPELPEDELRRREIEGWTALIAATFGVPVWILRKEATMWDRATKKGNAWIDEHVMGEEMIDLLPGEMGFSPKGRTTLPGRYRKWSIGREAGDAKHISWSPSYTAQPGDALVALEKFLEQGTHFVEISHAGACLSWQCALIPKQGRRTRKRIVVGHGTFCLAICMALYRAITEEEEK